MLDLNKNIRTRGGKKVTVITTTGPGEKPIIVIIEGVERPFVYPLSGRFSSFSETHQNDLVNYLDDPPEGCKWCGGSFDWTGQLPNSYRPLCVGEKAEIGDEYFIFGDKWEKINKPFVASCNSINRTTRPLYSHMQYRIAFESGEKIEGSISNNLWVPVVKIRDFDITGAVFRKVKPDYYDLIPFGSYVKFEGLEAKFFITTITKEGITYNGNFEKYSELEGFKIILPNGNKLTL